MQQIANSASEEDGGSKSLGTTCSMQAQVHLSPGPRLRSETPEPTNRRPGGSSRAEGPASATGGRRGALAWLPSCHPASAPRGHPCASLAILAPTLTQPRAVLEVTGMTCGLVRRSSPSSANAATRVGGQRCMLLCAVGHAPVRGAFPR
jgi:hypothetical protein